MKRLLTALAALAAIAASLVLVTTAGADDVSSTPASVTITAGDAGATIAVSIVAMDDDGQVGCNVDGPNPATVTFTAVAPVVATPGGLSFQNCHQSKDVTVSAPESAAAGDYTVDVAVTGGVGGTYTVNPATILVHINAAPPPPTDTTPPTLSLPSSFTVQATSAAGAAATYTASASDGGNAVAVSCNPPSGSTFGLGPTTVTCSATDASGNSATGTFQITVQDTAGPVLALPAGMTVEATNSAGATVNFDATAVDAVDGARPVTCNPASGSTFPTGTTSVSCTSVDSRGNPSSGSFSVLVTNAPPVLVVPPTQTVEASGPNGANVMYVPTPSASDTVDGALTPSCTRPSGAVFPLGRTTVTCTATDSNGSSVSASFEVAVVDTTPPVVTVPPPWTFVGDNGLPRTNASLAVYLGRGRATDIVDPAPMLVIEAPAVLPFGTTQVRYVAVDSAGNIASDSTFITVVPPPPAGQPRPPAPPPPDAPPGNVSALRARPGNALVRISWTAPRDADVVRYAAFRSERSGPVVQVYSGPARSFVDRGLANGVEYRYVVVAFDRAGNRSAGVAVLATPRLPMLLAPRDGARLARGTTFSWRRVTGARYYNFQLFRAAGSGRLVKLMSVWPVTNRYRLPATWTFGGRRYRLSPGTYRWFVWPGLGARADARYGELLGERTFTITNRRR